MAESPPTSETRVQQLTIHENKLFYGRIQKGISGTGHGVSSHNNHGNRSILSQLSKLIIQESEVLTFEMSKTKIVKRLDARSNK